MIDAIYTSSLLSDMAPLPSPPPAASRVVVRNDRSTDILKAVSEFRREHRKVLDGAGFHHMQLTRLLGEADQDNEDLKTLLSTFLVVADIEEMRDRDRAMGGGRRTVLWLREAVNLTESRYLRYNLGFYCEHGLGVAVDYYEAVRLYKLSASKDYGPAMGRLGYCYMKGYGVKKKDDILALKYLKLSVNTVKKLELKWRNTIQKLEESVAKDAADALFSSSSSAPHVKRVVNKALSIPMTNKKSKDDQAPTTVDDSATGTRVVCQGCNRRGHNREYCKLAQHPDFNKHGPWVGSKVEHAVRVWVTGRDEVLLPWKQRADGTPWEEWKEKIEAQSTTPSSNNDSVAPQVRRCNYHPNSKSHWTKDCRDGSKCRPLRSSREVLFVPPDVADERYHDHDHDIHMNERYRDPHYHISSSRRYSAEEEGEQGEADEYCDRRGEMSSNRNYDRLQANYQLRTTR